MKINLNGRALNLDNDSSNKNLFEIMTENRETFYHSCAGKGHCGKCKLLVENISQPITAEELDLLSTFEINDGIRLACFIFPEENMTVESRTLADYKIEHSYSYQPQPTKLTDYGIIIDIGTTTIVLELIDLQSDQIVAHHSILNPQTRFGADVISRIDYCTKNSVEPLHRELQATLTSALKELTSSKKTITKIVISGNTTMIATLLNKDITSMGFHPYTVPVSKSLELTADALFPSLDLNCPIIVLPFIASFVGGDITSGLIAQGFFDNDEVAILVDLGTNGEIAIGNRNKIVTSATAAGPAFEGGGISCGIGSYAGAISDFDHELNFRTIHDQKPIGICGSGTISLISHLLRQEIIQECGKLAHGEAYTVTDNISLTQKDIRQIQYAKSAICSGIDGVIRHYGTTVENVDKIYLAGGFSQYIKVDDLFVMKLIPEALAPKVEITGNSSLAGARHVLVKGLETGQLIDMTNEIINVDMSTDKDYFDDYIDNLGFDHA